MAHFSSQKMMLGQIILVGLLIFSAHKHSKQKECLALYGIINWASQNNNQQNAHQINPSLSIRNCSSTNKKNQHDFGAEQCVIQ